MGDIHTRNIRLQEVKCEVCKQPMAREDRWEPSLRKQIVIVFCINPSCSNYHVQVPQ